MLYVKKPRTGSRANPGYVSIVRSDALTRAGKRNLIRKLWGWLSSWCVEQTIGTVHRQWVWRATLHPLCRVEGPSSALRVLSSAEPDGRDFLPTSPSRLPVVPGWVHPEPSQQRHSLARRRFMRTKHELDASAPASKRQWRGRGRLGRCAQDVLVSIATAVAARLSHYALSGTRATPDLPCHVRARLSVPSC